MWHPENVSVITDLEELIVGRLTSFLVAYVEMVLELRIEVTSTVARRALIGHPSSRHCRPIDMIHELTVDNLVASAVLLLFLYCVLHLCVWPPALGG